MDSKEFAQLLARVREGDEAAATQLVRHYEPLIRRVARMRLRSSSLTRWFDSIDIYQSIVPDFLRRLKGGEFQLDTPQDLENLLVTMARNKIVTKARGNHKEEQNLPVGFDVPDPAPAPPDQISDKDLAALARARLTDDEYRLFVAHHVEG
jgi:DNA-directed RNA polymerase specialized sigma24 family protein